MAAHQVPHDDWVDLVVVNGGGTFQLQNQGAAAIYLIENVVVKPTGNAGGYRLPGQANLSINTVAQLWARSGDIKPSPVYLSN